MKKTEVIFLAACLLAAAACFFLYLRPGSSGSRIEIYVKDELVGTYSLSEDQVVEAGEHNTVTIREGRASMTEADCPDHTCIRQGWTDRRETPIVCLPNEVVVMVAGDEEGEIDGMVQ